VNVSFS